MESPLVKQLVQALAAREGTLSFAESCTGGLLSAEVTKLAGVSTVYLGGVVSYANNVKKNVLHVPAHLLATVGAVSRPVALAMALGVRDLLQSQWSCAVTGIAGPGGGSLDKPVGTVFVAVVGPGLEVVEQLQLKGAREEIQKATVEAALKLLIRCVGS